MTTAWLGTLLLVALGGGVGGAARFWLSGVVARRFGEAFPWGTLLVNVSGAAVIGTLAGLLVSRGLQPDETVSHWTLLAVGVLGSYTTVSSLTLQTLALARRGESARAALNVVGSVVLCLGAAAAGYLAVLSLTVQV